MLPKDTKLRMPITHYLSNRHSASIITADFLSHQYHFFGHGLLSGRERIEQDT